MVPSNMEFGPEGELIGVRNSRLLAMAHLNVQIPAYELNQLRPVNLPRGIAILDSELSNQTIVGFTFLVVEKLVVFLGFMSQRLDDVDVKVRINGDQVPKALSGKFFIRYDCLMP